MVELGDKFHIDDPELKSPSETKQIMDESNMNKCYRVIGLVNGKVKFNDVEQAVSSDDAIAACKLFLVKLMLQHLDESVFKKELKVLVNEGEWMAS